MESTCSNSSKDICLSGYNLLSTTIVILITKSHMECLKDLYWNLFDLFLYMNEFSKGSDLFFQFYLQMTQVCSLREYISIIKYMYRELETNYMRIFFDSP